MKVAIIIFSPSGNTLKVAKMLENSLMDRDIQAQMIDVTRDKKLFGERNFKQFLKETVRSHNLLCIGGPVYVHHMHYNIQNLIKALPQPGNEALPIIGDLAERISNLEGVSPNKCLDISGELNYQSILQKIKCLFIREGLIIFPKVTFDYDKCEKCGKCIDICPVQCLEMTDTGPRKKSNGAKCIHCGECFYNCPFDAAGHSMKKHEGMLMKAADGYGFLSSNEAPVSAVYPLKLKNRKDVIL